jgi:uncharacterized cupredoxin-like copper-binding protein
MRRVAIVLLALAACQTASGSSTDVELYEFGIDPSVSSLVAGAIDLTVSNSGEYPHTLVITDAGGHVVSAGAVVAPGETAEMTVDLAPGEYTFTCRIVGQDDDGNVVDHFEEGMAAGITVS